MSDIQENGLSSYIVDTVLKAIQDNTIGGVVDNYTFASFPLYGGIPNRLMLIL